MAVRCLRLSQPQPTATAIALALQSRTHLRPQRCLLPREQRLPALRQPQQRRAFSSKLSSLWAMSKGEMGQQPRLPSERSAKLAAKDMMKMPSDLGLLPQTFIFPRRALRPNLFSDPRSLVKLYWIHLKRKAQCLFARIIYAVTNKPRLKLRSREIAPTALGLHRQMYTAFAEGNTEVLNRICADGLRDSFVKRIAARPRGERWEWELVKYKGRARVVSHRAASLGIDGMGLRQAVVRIPSRQRLTRYKADGTVVPRSGVEKDTVEYLVIQKTLDKFVEGEWIIWGTTEETTMEMLREEEEAANSPQGS